LRSEFLRQANGKTGIQKMMEFKGQRPIQWPAYRNDRMSILFPVPEIWGVEKSLFSWLFVFLSIFEVGYLRMLNTKFDEISQNDASFQGLHLLVPLLSRCATSDGAVTRRSGPLSSFRKNSVYGWSSDCYISVTVTVWDRKVLLTAVCWYR
jgi:hypothetical protein